MCMVTKTTKITLEKIHQKTYEKEKDLMVKKKKMKKYCVFVLPKTLKMSVSLFCLRLVDIIIDHVWGYYCSNTVSVVAFFSMTRVIPQKISKPENLFLF